MKDGNLTWFPRKISQALFLILVVLSQDSNWTRTYLALKSVRCINCPKNGQVSLPGAEGLGLDDLSGPFQPKPFHDSMIM